MHPWTCAGKSTAGYEAVLDNTEREAVADLLSYLESECRWTSAGSCCCVAARYWQLVPASDGLPGVHANAFADLALVCFRSDSHPLPTQPDRSETNFFSGDPLRSLSTLSYSENVDLQRSAALAFAEITEKWVQRVSSFAPGSLLTSRSELLATSVQGCARSRS